MLFRSLPYVNQSNKSKKTKSHSRPNVFNVSDSCAGKRIVKQDIQKTNDDCSFVKISAKTVDLHDDLLFKSVICDSKTVKPATAYRTRKNKIVEPYVFLKEGEEPCGQGPRPTLCKKLNGPFPNSLPLKKQTCFNCGVAGHIARNCPHRPYVPYYAQRWENVSRGSSSKRNPSQSRSDGDWNADKDNKTKNQTHKNKQIDKQVDRPKDLERDNVILQLLSKLLSVTWPKNRKPKKKQKDMKVDSKDTFSKPSSVKTTSSQGSSSNSYLKNKPKAKGGPDSKSSVETPIRSNHKPNYRWIPKIDTSCCLSNEQDMSWEPVLVLDGDGEPSVKMDWVPKTV